MPDDPMIPLQQATALADASLCDIKSIQDILDLVVENIVANSQAVLAAIDNGVVFSPTAPTGNNFGKLWVKTTGGGVTDPRGVGIVLANTGAYSIIPVPQDQNTGVPSGFIGIWPNSTPPAGWTQFGSASPPVGNIYIQRL